MLIRSSAAAEAIGGLHFGDDCEFDGVSFDSRMIRENEAFIALVGERDGHEFLGDATRTARVVIVQHGRRPQNFTGTTIEVDDTAQALLKLGKFARSLLSPTHGNVIGITGSVGKTTTKDFTAAALRSTLPNVTASPKSFNNDIGVPVTLLASPLDVDAVVLEMAMRGFGEIERLCDVASPRIGVVTRVGEAHTDRVGGIDGVARAKSELVVALPEDGVAILNSDDERVLAMSSLCRGSVVTYGFASDADVNVRSLATDEEGRVVCVATISSTGDSCTFRCPVAGRHMVSNAAAAIAVAHVLEIPLETACRAIEQSEVSDGRMQRRSSTAGAIILDDSYNANPTSTEAALRTIASLDVPRKVAVLGVMAEIADPHDGHARIARLAHELSVELIAVGTDLYGVPSTSMTDVARLLQHDDDGTAILIKGSRVAGLDQLVRLLTTQ